MELDALKSTWNSISSKQEMNNHISENDLQQILQKRTIDISEKIARNIKIGIYLLLSWVVLDILFSFLLNRVFKNILDSIKFDNKILLAIYILEILTYALMFFVIIWFAIRHKQIKKENRNNNNLKEKLQNLINTLTSYKRFFYSILVFILLFVIVSFSTGFYQGYSTKLTEAGLTFSDLNAKAWIIAVIGFIVSLSIITAIYYLLFNLFFKRLYGRYLTQLKATLNELTEVEYNTNIAYS